LCQCGCKSPIASESQDIAQREGKEALIWKVRRTEDEDGVILSLSGRPQREDLNELRRVFASEATGPSLILDLKDLRLVDQAVVAFLAYCEASGASIRNCPSYIHEWISAEQAATESLPK
jgi:hypothetical protein